MTITNNPLLASNKAADAYIKDATSGLSASPKRARSRGVSFAPDAGDDIEDKSSGAVCNFIAFCFVLFCCT